MIALVADASRDVLEAPLGDEAEPPCGVALALQLFALEVSHLLDLALAKHAQRLNVDTVFPEFLFHCSCPKIGRGYGLFIKSMLPSFPYPTCGCVRGSHFHARQKAS